MKLLSVQGQLSIRAEEILPPALFPFSLQSIFLLLENTFKSSENPFAASLGFRSQIFKDISYFVCLAWTYSSKEKTVINFLVVISLTQILSCSQSFYNRILVI